MSRRIRRHANPFNVVTDLGQVDPKALFGREAPMEWDLGCGAGAFLMERAERAPDLNFVGLEVRKPLVEAANRRAEAAGLTNLRFLYANANVNLAAQTPGGITRFTVQFPDPCFKKRHWKRRILQPQLVRQMAEILPIGGEVYAQSDVKPLAEEMYSFLLAESALSSMWGSELKRPSPYPERTEWERQHEREGEPVYRMLFRKIQAPSGPVLEQPFRETDPSRILAAEQAEQQAAPRLSKSRRRCCTMPRHAVWAVSSSTAKPMTAVARCSGCKTKVSTPVRLDASIE